MFQIHVKRTFIFLILGIGLGLLLASTLPKVYETDTEMFLSATGTSGQNMPEDIAQIFQSGMASSIPGQVAVLQSKGVFAQALQEVAQQRGDNTLMRQLDDLFKDYRVQAFRGSPVVRVTVRAPDPALARDVANTVPGIYNDRSDELAERSVSTALKTLEDQLDTTRTKLDQIDDEIRTFMEQHNVANVAAKASEEASYQASLQVQRDALQAQLRGLQARLSNEKSIASRFDKTEIRTSSESENPLVSKLRGQLADLEAGKIAALTIYTEESREVKLIEEQITQVRSQLSQALKDPWLATNREHAIQPIRATMESSSAQTEAAIAETRQKLSQIQADLQKQESIVAKSPRREMEYVNLLREREVLNSRYMGLRSTSEDLRNRTTASKLEAPILSIAPLPTAPTSPDPVRFSIVGAMAGGILGLLFSFLSEALRLPVRTSGQLAELTGLPVAATVPRLPGSRARKTLGLLGDSKFKPVESLRFMAFSLINPSDPGPKMIMFTGIGGGVGCSSTAGQFAVALAKAGVKTLLVDCDLRHPTLTAAMDAEKKSGLSDMLNRSMLPSDGDLSLETKHKNLMFLPAGVDKVEDLTEFPTVLISGMLQSLKDYADVVVVDAPPCDVVSDTSRLVPYMDQVCLVVSAKSTSYRSVPVAYEILKRCGAKTIEMILTHASPSDEPFARSSRYLINVSH